MEQLVRKYEKKLIQAGLAQNFGPQRPLVAGLDDRIFWNRDASTIPVFKKLFDRLNINSLICIHPKEPYASIIRYLSKKAPDQNNLITPKDCETRTFLHDLPVVEGFKSDQIIDVLKKRKSVIVAQTQEESLPLLLAHGTVSPEQAFVTISSVCFACFIKFFTDYLENCRNCISDPVADKVFAKSKSHITPLNKSFSMQHHAPFKNESDVYKAIIEAGKKTVEYGLVDSYFGNVSYLWHNTLYISQTGSSLDELDACIDPVPLDGSTSAGLTASSELSAHLKTIEKTGARAILHGHPKFSVILSMDCDPLEKKGCPFNEQCHVKCPKKRFLGRTPIVPGEVGTGPTGLCNTLPAALEVCDSAIVYGHGLFTISKNDFSEAFANMLTVEEHCRTKYFDLILRLKEETT